MEETKHQKLKLKLDMSVSHSAHSKDSKNQKGISKSLIGSTKGFLSSHGKGFL